MPIVICSIMPAMPLEDFHPAVAGWFEQHFARPTEVQKQAWPSIRAGRNTLLAAPTGSGKTLAAFLSAIDELISESLERGLPDETRVLYVSPLKALSNDIQKNLQQPLQGISDALLESGLPNPNVRVLVRTGDTPQSDRARMRREPPHILVTTPESLYILLTSDSGRRMLQTVRTVIVDEIHAVAGNKRGAHLSLSLERLEHLCAEPPVRIGISATQKPIQTMADFLIGSRQRDCTIVDTGFVRERDLALELTDSPIEAIMSNEVWEEVYNRLAELISAHRTTLIFVNTRRLAERAARHLAERIGEENVTSHHGSLAREHRLRAEQRLKAGELRALVATASLELGIDIGEIDLVCQMGSPRAIAAFLQRVGRSGHGVDMLPKGRLFPLSRDDLVESVAILDAVRREELDRIKIPEQPLDVLSQQLVAEVSGAEWSEDQLYDCVRVAWPYRNLDRATFDKVVAMLAQGFSTRRGRRSAYLHRDGVNNVLRGRRGAKLVAVTNGGAIPDQFDYDVVLAPHGLPIGNLNEDFAFESLPGDIFQLGNTSYRILKIETGKVHVEDARGQPPNIPFWIGEAPGRTDELSQSVSRLREELSSKLDQGVEAAEAWLAETIGLDPSPRRQLIEYLGTAKAALGVLPTQKTVMLERFFDENGDTHVVIHSSFGSRLNRAWGLALRKRFCRKFNFELQAAALEDSIVLSLGPTHSFPLDEMSRYLASATARDILIQALLDAPMFGTRWRWNATISLAVKRNRNGKRQPAQFQRTDAEDLLAVVFPDQLACLENVVGRREIPDHPLVMQTIDDCLNETMDINGLERVLKKLEAGELEIVARDLTSPSPLSQEILNARPYAFLDDAPAEERRTMAVQSRRFTEPEDAADLGRLDSQAITKVRQQAWPDARTADELHDGLVILGFLSEEEAQRGPLEPTPGLELGWRHLFDTLAGDRRATVLETPAGAKLWVAAERLQQFEQVFPDAVRTPPIDALADLSTECATREDALRELIRSRLKGLGPVTAAQLAAPLGLPESDIDAALLALQTEGFVMQGHFTGAVTDGPTEWCERRLLARIHRYTLGRLRSEIEPVSAADYMRFLFRWQNTGADRGEGAEALATVIEQLEGFAVPAAAWEAEILPARVDRFVPGMLDTLCNSGRFVWLRRSPPNTNGSRRSNPVRNTPIVMIARANLPHWSSQQETGEEALQRLSSTARRLLDVLNNQGASFFLDLVQSSGLLRTQVEEALGELVASGWVTADNFAGLRALTTPPSRRRGYGRLRRGLAPSVDDAGRWVLLKRDVAEDPPSDLNDPTALHVAMVLLRRYGVMFRKLLDRESNLPPWRVLLHTYRRLEARGEIRGGRFVEGFSGEQFALPEAVATLREVRRRAPSGELHVVSAADPLNLAGIITPGSRITATTDNRVLYRDGVPIAAQVAGEFDWLAEQDASSEWEARNLLIRRHRGAQYLSSSRRPV